MRPRFHGGETRAFPNFEILLGRETLFPRLFICQSAVCVLVVSPSHPPSASSSSSPSSAEKAACQKPLLYCYKAYKKRKPFFALPRNKEDKKNIIGLSPQTARCGVGLGIQEGAKHTRNFCSLDLEPALLSVILVLFLGLLV